MLRPMEVPVATTGIDKATRAMQELAAATRETGAAARAIRMPAASAPGGAMSIRRQGAIAAAATSAQAMQVRARAALTTAQVRADTQAMRAQAAQAVAARQLNRALSPTPAAATPQQRVMNAVMSTRFGVGGAGGVQPLIGRTLAAAGIGGAAAMPFLAAAAAASLSARAMQELARFVSEASANINRFGAAVTVSGGTGAQVASLRGMGLSAGEIGGAAAGLRERISSDPMARMASLRLGLGATLPRPFGSVNEAANLQKALEALRNITNAEEQLRLARMLSLDGYLDQIRVSNDVWNRGQRIAALNARIYDPKTVQVARDLAGEQRNITRGWDNLAGVLAKPFLRPGRDIAATGAGAMEKAAGALNTPIGQGALKGVIASLIPIILGPMAGIYGPLAGMAFLAHQGDSKGVGGSGDPHATAQDASIQALKDLTAQLYKMNQNLGGGPRTSGADPGRLAGSQYGNPDVYGKMDSAERDRRMREVEAQRYGPWAR